MIPTFYQNHLRSQLSLAEYLLLKILLQILQSIKQVSLESLANALPIPIKFESRRRKIQRFLSLPKLTIKKIWLPIIEVWLETYLQEKETIYLVIDRTKWSCINLLMISMVWEKRAIPIYFELLKQKGNSNLKQQTEALTEILAIVKKYKICVLGDREFCSVKLANWLKQQGLSFCLRLRKNEFVKKESDIWLELKDLGLAPGLSLFLPGVKVTKLRGFGYFNLACKWKRKLQGIAPKEGWFILTDLPELGAAITAYKQRFDIEEMFRDFKTGGYNLEDTKVTGERLISLILLIAIAYTSATIQGQQIKRKGVQEYVGRVKENSRSTRRHSSFYIGLYGYTWISFMDNCQPLVAQLMRLNPNKRKYYQQGLRAMNLIQSVF
ncbi:IS4 family transposase [Anabaena sp. PCC 7108]|uniref:IS4 family transposase n=1 Tax=Anabaena sp. PCC 7108 TaxID=163908 RepID=UPI000476F1EC|nr:IS4 family transposase [Anabaena sp. PCC 7108]